jgi:hypothetical protein
MESEFGGTGIQTWTTVDISAVDMRSKSISVYSTSTSRALNGVATKWADTVELDYVRDVSRRSRRFRNLARDASRSGKRLVIEIHDRNPVKIITTRPAL